MALSKTRTILERREEWPPTFHSDDESVRETTVVLDREIYNDMGRPAIITVTVEPGDLLNTPEEASDGAVTSTEP